jgi:hypothetical protein
MRCKVIFSVQALVTDLEIVEAGKGVHTLSVDFLAAGSTDKKTEAQTTEAAFKDPVADNK